MRSLTGHVAQSCSVLHSFAHAIIYGICEAVTFAVTASDVAEWEPLLCAQIASNLVPEVGIEPTRGVNPTGF
jgi:hypothetical protein